MRGNKLVAFVPGASELCHTLVWSHHAATRSCLRLTEILERYMRPTRAYPGAVTGTAKRLVARVALVSPYEL